MSYSYKTQKYLKTKTLNEILEDFELPLSISLGKKSTILEKVIIQIGRKRFSYIVAQINQQNLVGKFYSHYVTRKN